jgi:hypothetical protein
MKLKKKVKRMIAIVIVLLVLVAAGVGALIIFKNPEKPKVSEVKIVNEVDKYDYKLKENKTSTYKKMFDELKKILKEEPVDEEAYAKKVAEMFVYDFYSLEDKAAKTDIGGVDFVYPGVLENFLQNAQDTYYKYVESNIYNERKQDLPVVSNVTIDNIEKKEFAYGDQTDSSAYAVNVSWSYTEDKYAKYQNKATIILIHDGIKLSIVELQ